MTAVMTAAMTYHRDAMLLKSDSDNSCASSTTSTATARPATTILSLTANASRSSGSRSSSAKYEGEYAFTLYTWKSLFMRESTQRSPSFMKVRTPARFMRDSLSAADAASAAARDFAARCSDAARADSNTADRKSVV